MFLQEKMLCIKYLLKALTFIFTKISPKKILKLWKAKKKANWAPAIPDQLCWCCCIDKLRRSMPNLIRAPSMPSVPSIPCLASPVNPPSHGPSSLPTMPSLRNSQSFDSSSGLARLQSSSKTPVFMCAMIKERKKNRFYKLLTLSLMMTT